MRKQEVEVLPINKAISFSEGRAVDGLLGCPFLEHFVVEIDYANNRVSFHEPEKFKYTGQAEAIPLEIDKGNIFIRANLVLPKRNARRGKISDRYRMAFRDFINGSLRARAQIARSGGDDDRGDDRCRDWRSDNAYGGTHQCLEIGRHTIKNPVTDFSEATSGILAAKDFSGIIGAEILRRFTVIFDYPQRRMMLQPNAHFDEPHDFDMSGLYLTAEGKDFKTFNVYKVIPSSPGGAAGVREGDQIWLINGKPANKFTLDQIRQMFRQPEKEYSLGIIRGEKSVQTKLTTRRLL